MRMSSGALLALVMLGATIGPTSAQDVHTGNHLGGLGDQPSLSSRRICPVVK